jgi:phosphoribosylaminoimidazolecarboxamide formyltransferase/IMP cyclohydrolase
MTRYCRALISVADKTNVADLAKSLINLDIEILSTGGTAAVLRQHGIAVTDVSEVTGFPEIMDGRVKTLHPLIHGGLLGRRDRDGPVMEEHGIRPIDLLVVNLYPFEVTVSRPACNRTEAIENIDIGGPAMIRAAAKNHEFVAVVVDPADYKKIVAELNTRDVSLSQTTRQRLATKAFAHTASYDAAIWNYLCEESAEDRFSLNYPLSLKKQSALRYGENPHQRAALYRLPKYIPGTVISAHQHQGKSLSYNNIADADAALECVKTLQKISCVIVKHANPCGVGIGQNALEAYEKAYATDPTSAFGGIIALNDAVDAELANAIIDRQFLEVIVAPGYSSDAIEAFARKPNIRVLETGPLTSSEPGVRMQQIAGGMLVQDSDIVSLDRAALKVVTERRPDDQELSDAMLAWEIARFVKSNAIVYCKDGATVGIGAGQMSRVMSAKIAAWKADDAGLDVTGAAMASDAFFPFRDGVDIAAEHGISVVIQPGGSVRDVEVINAANEHGMAMLFTGMRHFFH